MEGNADPKTENLLACNWDPVDWVKNTENAFLLP